MVYAKRPFGGPEHVLHYLARYTHRVAISNHRLVNFADGKVTFRWKDYAHNGKQRMMTVTAEEFLRRFLLHVLAEFTLFQCANARLNRDWGYRRIRVHWQIWGTNLHSAHPTF